MRELIAAGEQHRSLIRRMYELYIYDFSPMTGTDLTDDGWWTDEHFPEAWPAQGREIYLFRVDGQWAGFAFVKRGSYLQPGAAQNSVMDEFFVMRKYRRQGVGTHFAQRLFDRYPGTWEVGEIVENVEAQKFWRAVIGAYTGGRYTEQMANNAAWKGPVQIFAAGGGGGAASGHGGGSG